MKRKWIQKEREQEHLGLIYPISSTYLDIKEREQEREGRMDSKTEWKRQTEVGCTMAQPKG